MWLDPATLQRFAGSLLHFFWQGAAVALVAAVSLKLLRHRSPEARYAVAIVALALMAAAPVLTFIFYAQTGAVALRLLQWTGRMLTDSRALYPLTESTPAWTYGIVGVWCSGVTLLTARLIVSWALSRSLVRSATRRIPETLQQTFDQLKRTILPERAVRLLVQTRIDSPVVIGWLRPAILIPLSALTGLEENQLIAILAHELAHIRRHDFVVNILQRCAESALFYHPGIWWLSARIRMERENCCDDLAVRFCGSRRLYAQALVNLERKRVLAPKLAVAMTGGRLRDRVQRLLGFQATGVDWESIAATFVFIMIWMLAGLWQSNTLRAAPGASPEMPTTEAVSASLAEVPKVPVQGALNAIAGILTAQPAPAIAAPPAAGMIQGVVTRAGSHEPIQNAQITIEGDFDNPRAFGALMTALAPFGIQRNPNAQQDEQRLVQGLNNAALNRGVPLLDLDYLDALRTFRSATAQFSATSDSSGKFTLKDVPPGQYIVRTERESFFPVAPAGMADTVAKAVVRMAEPRTLNVEIPMAPGGTIGGRVLDAFNRPLSNGHVEAFSVTYQGGYPILQAAAADTTDDRGEFRLFWLPAGEYYIAVNPRPAPLDTAGRTYYPGTMEVTKATPVLLRADGNVEGINYAVRNSRAVTLSGTVRSLIPGNGGVQVVLMLVLRGESIPDNTGERVAARTLLTPASGRFEIPGVPPGAYDVYARMPDSNPGRLTNGNGMAFGRATVNVLDEDVSDIQIDIHPTVSVAGSIVSAAGSETWATARLSVQVEGSAAKIPFFQSAVAARVVSAGRDGAFRLPAVPQGHYHLLVDGLPKGAYVADVRQGAASVFDSGFDVGLESPAPIQVVLASNGGTLQGIVQNVDGKIVPGSTVVLVPIQHRRLNWLLYRTAVADSSGRYTLHSIAPGDYTLFAWESVSPGAYYSVRFLETYEGQGRTFRITPSSAASQVTVKIAGGR